MENQPTPDCDSFLCGAEQAEITLAARNEQLESLSAPGLMERAAKIPVIFEGDSWMDYPFNDIASCLEDDYNYDVYSVAHAGDSVEEMAYSDGQLMKLLRAIEKMIDRDTPPRAFVLSGGGNDIAGHEFAQLLNNSLSPRRGLNERILSGVIDERLFDSYAHIIGGVTRLCEERLSTRIPILIHGYDYAVPDGRGVLGGWWKLPGPWLLPSLKLKGYSNESERFETVKTMIDRFNAMQISLVAQTGFEHVRHIDLRGSFSNGHYKDWWANELHPTRRGFKLVAQRFAEQLPS